MIRSNRADGSRPRRRLRGVAAIAALAGLATVFAASLTGAVNAGHVVIAVAGDDGVGLDGYSSASPVTVEVVRGSLVVGRAGPFVPVAGVVEINHVGNLECWSGMTPDIVHGDTIRVTQNGTVETSIVRTMSVEAAQVGALANTVEVHGTAQANADIPDIEVRLISPALQPFSGGGPFLRTPGNGTVSADAPGSLAWTAVFPTSGAQMQAAALGADVEAGWLSPDGTEGTSVGAGAVGGPAVPDCTAPSGRYAVTSTTPNVLRDNATALTVEGAAALDATAVSVSVSDTSPLTPDAVAAGTLTVHGGAQTWSATVAAGDLAPLVDGPLTVTPTFTVAAPPDITGLARTILKDPLGPPVILDVAPVSPSATSNATFAFHTPIDGLTIQCRLVPQSFAPCASPVTYTGLLNGAYAFEVRALDGAPGPTIHHDWTINRPVPVAQIANGPAALVNTTSATFDFVATPTAFGFQCKLDAAAFAACAPHHVIGGPLAAGSHTLLVRALDEVGNIGPQASRVWTIDLTPPDTTISDGPLPITNNPNATFTFGSTDASATFECSLDAAAFTACASPASYLDLPDGNHTFQVRARDGAGNVDASPATRNWALNGPPNTLFTQAPPVKGLATTATFGFVANDPAATFECSLDDQPFGFCTSPVALTNLPLGVHTFRVRAVDSLSQIDPTPATHQWSILLADLEPPTLRASIPNARRPTVAKTGVLRFTGRCSEECRISARAIVTVTSPIRGRKPRIFRLRSSQAHVRAGVTAALRVKLNAVQLQAVRKSLRAGKRVRIRLIVLATDVEGNRTNAIPAITLTRRNLR